LASALSGYFWLRRRHATQWLSIGAAGLAAATARADQRGLAGAHLNLGLANRCLGRYTEAVEHTSEALALSASACASGNPTASAVPSCPRAPVIRMRRYLSRTGSAMRCSTGA